jgi:hypothetical protein
MGSGNESPATIQEVAMAGSTDPGVAQRTPRRASSIRTWLAPARNHDWVAARIAFG